MMEDQAASLRRLTPGAQMGRSFAFLGVPGGGTTTLLAELGGGRAASRNNPEPKIRWRRGRPPHNGAWSCLMPTAAIPWHGGFPMSAA